MPCSKSAPDRFVPRPRARRHLPVGALLALAVANFACGAQDLARMPRVELNVGIHLIHAELADNDANRMLGLMYRTQLAPSHGMLFVFDQAGQQCMWMHNTYLPLSVAFLDASAAVINIEEMKAQTDDSHCARRPARYALEMGAKWFEQHGVREGTVIQGVVANTRH